MRVCNDCKFDMDAVSMVKDCEHKWHGEVTRPDGYIGDMCCNCGLDEEILWK